MSTPTPDEIYRGYLRYEFVRTLSPYRFSELFQRSLETGESFDSLVDEAMTGIKGMSYKLYPMQEVRVSQVKLPEILPITTPLASTEDMENDRLYRKWNEPSKGVNQ